MPHIKTKSSDALITAQIKALDSLKNSNKEIDRSAYYEWHLRTLKAKKSPFQVTNSTLKKYVGSYGKRTITLEEDVLYYQREGSEKVELIPLESDLFQYGNLTDVRVKFLNTDQNIEALTMHNAYGRSDTYKKLDD